MSPFTGDRRKNDRGKSRPWLAASVVDPCPAVAAKIDDALLKFGVLMLLLERFGIHAWNWLDDLDGPTATAEFEEVHKIGGMQIRISCTEETLYPCPDMLFDLQNDPLESVNQIDNPQLGKVRAELVDAIEHWIAKTPSGRRNGIVDSQLRRSNRYVLSTRYDCLFLLFDTT
jgi:hypothetical protein